MDTPAETPLADHVAKALETLAQGGRLRVDSGPGFPLASYSFGGDVSKELALRIADPDAARRHAVTVEQTALFVDSEPLADGLMGVAAFLRSLAGDH